MINCFMGSCELDSNFSAQCKCSSGWTGWHCSLKIAPWNTRFSKLNFSTSFVFFFFEKRFFCSSKGTTSLFLLKAHFFQIHWLYFIRSKKRQKRSSLPSVGDLVARWFSLSRLAVRLQVAVSLLHFSSRLLFLKIQNFVSCRVFVEFRVFRRHQIQNLFWLVLKKFNF